jgi:hypothetical protein
VFFYLVKFGFLAKIKKTPTIGVFLTPGLSNRGSRYLGQPMALEKNSIK